MAVFLPREHEIIKAILAPQLDRNSLQSSHLAHAECSQEWCMECAEIYPLTGRTLSCFPFQVDSLLGAVFG